MKIHKKDIRKSVSFYKLSFGDTFKTFISDKSIKPTHNEEVFMKVQSCNGGAVCLDDGRMASFRLNLPVMPIYRKES